MNQEAPPVAGNDELPTYDDLASKEGPNSRFGRWKDWVEKRAAERYAEDTPERRHARRMKGWGPHVDTQDLDTPQNAEALSSRPLPVPPQPQPSSLRRTRTAFSNSAPPESDKNQASSAAYTTRGQALPPSHLKLHTFGSRFLPHSDHPILTLLPLFNDTKLLIGHTNGLSVLDLNPDAPLSEVGSHEPRRRDIWYGEGVYQLALLENEQLSANGTPQGVVLALVGAEPPEGASERDSKEYNKTIRMYNLASLASITSWATSGKDHQPLRLSRLSHWEAQQPVPKKQKQQLSASRGSRSQKSNVSARDIHPYDLDVPPTPPPKDPPRGTPSPVHGRAHGSTATDEGSALGRSGSPGSDWEIVGHENLPLRWATDFVPLASANSKLGTQSVLFFELCRCPGGGWITARLAVVTKQNVFFYESVRGERAFRFVKEFYTPTPARSARFVYQGSDGSARMHLSASTSMAPAHFSTLGSHSRGNSTAASSRRASSAGELPLPVALLSLFLVFEKKAGLIRIADSSVGEVDLWGDGGGAAKSTFRRSITHLESLTGKEWKGAWAPPAEATLPGGAGAGAEVYFLTRGRRTHIVPAPLPTPLAGHAPLQVLTWGMQPRQVVPRTCERPGSGERYLQVAALGEDGVEVQELSLAFLGAARGKGKERAGGAPGAAGAETVVAEAEVGPGGAGFLCMGGHWTEVQRTPGLLQRHVSAGTTDSAELCAQRAREQGFYAWTQKGYDDWRVFWLGGDAHDTAPPVSP